MLDLRLPRSPAGRLGVAISDPENTSNFSVFGTSDKPFAPDAWQSQNGWDARSVVRATDRTLPERKRDLVYFVRSTLRAVEGKIHQVPFSLPQPKERAMNRSRSVVVGLLTLLCAFLFAGALAAQEDKPEWKPLMDGKTLAGWHKVGDGEWTVEDGAFVGRADNAKLYGLLGDSGFYIRTIIKEPEKAHGLQVQVGRTGSGVGGIYESYGRGWVDKPTLDEEKEYVKDDEWNEMTIDAHGGNVVVHVNGVKTAELKDDPSRPEGHFALQMHAGCVMEVLFKEIEIR